MSIAALIRSMSEAGAPAEAIAIAVDAIEARDAALAAKRAVERDRKRRQRAGQSRDSHGTVTGQSGDNARTERDQNTPPKNVPHTPYKITPLKTSLRSDTSGRAFDRFWQAYPRKTERKAAEAKFLSLIKSGVDPEAIIAGAERYAASNPEPKFTKHPTTWLNRGCWDDEQLPRDGPRREEPGSFLAYAASGQWKQDLLDDEQRSSEHHSGESSGPAEPPRRGPDRDVSQSAASQPGGTLLDLRAAGSRWY